MSKLDRFLAKPQMKKVMGEELKIYPLTMKNIDLFVKAGSDNPDVKQKAIQEMMTISLKCTFPEEDVSKFGNLPLEFVTEYMQALSEVNGVAGDTAGGSSKIKELNEKMKL